MKPHSNARFWTWWNGGWVKLTLRPGQRLVLHAFRRTDEGYSEQHEEYKHEGSAVRCEQYDSGRDCDGYTEHYSEHHCRLDQLQDDSAFERWSVPENEGIYTPAWQKLSAGQRDEYAELAGY
jgi:hypothetical protein